MPMLKRLFIALMFLAVSGGAKAVDYTDIWYLPAESGWGVNVVQSDNFLFMTFFIYGQDNHPTWYTAQVSRDASGNFNGTLFSTMGTYFLLPWMGVTQVPAGTASFQPTGPYTATLLYTVTGVGSVTKSIQRQPLTAITIGGSYTGGLDLAQTGCANSGSGTLNVDLQVNQTPSGPVLIAMNRSDGLSCNFSGPAILWGKLYQMSNARYTCSNGRNTFANIDELAATAHGIDGVWSAQVEGGCTETGTFAAVLR